ncbi:MAG: hypothetical protein M3Y49_16845, partial [Actinomycetota bacterium]|nr:hypothetical protein [Actinomycetota bacterium]
MPYEAVPEPDASLLDVATLGDCVVVDPEGPALGWDGTGGLTVRIGGSGRQIGDVGGTVVGGVVVGGV